MRVVELSFDTVFYEGSSTQVYGGVREADGARVVAKVGGGQRRLKREHLVLENSAGAGVVGALGLFESSNVRVVVGRRFGSRNLAEALRVHGARIVHREIKRASMLYAATEVAALADVGIAMELPVNARALPVADVVGTVGNLSPERSGRASESYDFRSCVYSLGVTLCEMLIGARPFDDEQLLEVVAAHGSRRPEPLHRRVALIAPVVSRIVRKLLAKMPDERYRSSRGLAEDLERWLETVTPEGRIASFELGQSDVRRRRFRQQLFDRGGELAALELAVPFVLALNDFEPAEAATVSLVGDRGFAFEWQPTRNEACELERVLVVLGDVTETLCRDELEREHKALMAIVGRLGEDRNGVIEFVKEVGGLVARLTTGRATPEVEKRLLHTVKGNAGLFGLSELATRCHEIEDAMALEARRMTDDERTSLGRAWKALHHKLLRFIGIGEGHDVELWGLESLGVRFQRIAEHARRLAQHLGKDPVRVQIEYGGVHVDRDVWAPFWSAFVHAVRNAIDHGIEDAEERVRLGKDAGRLTLRSYLRAGALVFELCDDGRGIAWDKLRDKARAAGLPTETRSDLVAALFHDGISTRAQITEMSGRGVGLGVLAEVCRTMGGTIAVDSVPGEGTTLRFEFRGARQVRGADARCRES